MIKEFSCGDINCCGVVLLVSVIILAICFIGVLAIVSKLEAKAYIAQCILRAARHWHKNQRQIILTERRTYQYKDYIRSLLQIKYCGSGQSNTYNGADL